MTTPRQIYNIPADLPFSDVLARVLLDRYQHQPLALSEVQIFLPTRRAVRNLSQSFLRASKGKALLLPRFHTLGDLDDDDLASVEGTEASEALLALADERTPWNDAHRVLVAMQMLSKARLGGPGQEVLSHDQQLSMAQALLRLLDQSETESLDIGNLKTLVEEQELAKHWEKSVDFLGLLADVWPALEESWGKISAARLRRLKAEAQVDIWQERPPTSPVIVAGTTASIPATRALLIAIDQLPNSEILLPGLDNDAAKSRATWHLIGQDPTHPQFGLHQLCAALDISAADVDDWPAAHDAQVRNRDLATRVALAQWSALPPEATQPQRDGGFDHGGWRDVPPGLSATNTADDLRRRAVNALGNIELIEALDQNQEAKIIALILRHTLDQPEKTAALVTPNRDLARMVSAQMRRWGLAVDDSAGTPLDKSPAALLVRTILDIVCDDAPPSSVLDLLKNPLMTTVDQQSVVSVERFALRGPQPGLGLGGIAAKLAQALERVRPEVTNGTARPVKLAQMAQIEQAIALVGRVEDTLKPLAELAADSSLADYSRTLCQVAERFVPHESLWAGNEGEALARMFAGLHEDTSTAQALKLADLRLFRNYLSGLMNRESVRLPYGTHPRISILGTLEARLLNVDHVVLGGLNEDSFPMNAPPGPWLSRHMRAKFGLPALERKVGLTAHDFVQSIGNRQVSLTRAVKQSGALTTPSRFLRRFESYLRQLEISQGLDLLGVFRQPIDQSLNWKAWAEELDRPLSDQRALGTPSFAQPAPTKRPTPNPVLARRPSVVHATDIEQWRANPYALYAKRVLRLRPWDPVQAQPDARMRGTLIHSAAESFVRAKEAARGQAAIAMGTPQTDLAFYLDAIHQEMDRLQLAPELRVLWASRIRHAGQWFVDQDTQRRLSGLTQTLVEASGSWHIALEASGHSVRVAAKADRIERYQDGHLAIVDYKTGTPPSARHVFEGKKPQLTIEALILRNGRIEDMGRESAKAKANANAARPLALEYWAMGGGKDPGKVTNIVPPNTMELTFEEALEDVEASLKQMLEDGLGRQTAFPATAAGWGDYHHLARLQEWSGLESTLTNRLSRNNDGGSVT